MFGTRCDSEERLGLDTVIKSITCNRRGTRHVLIRGVCARTDQTDLQLLGPVVGLDSLGELGDRCSKIRGERTVDMWLEFRKVELDDLVVLNGRLAFGHNLIKEKPCLSIFIRLQLFGEDTSEISDLRALGCRKIIVHAIVEGEQRSLYAD